MKKIKKILLLVSLATFSILPYGVAQENTFSKEGRSKISDKNILILYLSRTGNTEAVAEIIQEQVGGKMLEIETQIPYPKNYTTLVNQVSDEDDRGYLPTLKTKINNIDQYDIIFIGFPTWSMELPPPIKSFLKQYDLKNKVIVPFNTNAGYGVGSSFRTIRQLLPQSKVLDGYSTVGGKERDGIFFVMEGNKESEVRAEVKTWLQKIKLIK